MCVWGHSIAILTVEITIWTTNCNCKPMDFNVPFDHIYFFKFLFSRQMTSCLNAKILRMQPNVVILELTLNYTHDHNLTVHLLQERLELQFGVYVGEVQEGKPHGKGRSVRHVDGCNTCLWQIWQADNVPICTCPTGLYYRSEMSVKLPYTRRYGQLLGPANEFVYGLSLGIFLM